MRRLAVLALTAAALLLTACGSHPNTAACKRAMRAEFVAAWKNGAQGSEPAACKGLSDAELQKLVAQILAGN